jgi:hypothetical protein
MPQRLSCHCGAVALELAHAPTEITQCNCSICAKLGWLLCYAPRDQATILTPPENEQSYRRADIEAMLDVQRCRTCGVPVYWRAHDPAYTRMGFNARLIEGLDLERLPRRYVDGRRW